MRTFSISDKLIILFVAINIVAVGTVGYFSFYNSETALYKRIDQQLTTIKTVKKRQIEKYFEDRSNAINMIVSLINNTGCSKDSLNEYTAGLSSVQNKSDYYSSIFINTKDEQIPKGMSKQIFIDLNHKIEDFQKRNNVRKDTLQLIELVYADRNEFHLFYIQYLACNQIVFELKKENIEKMMLENSANDGFGDSGESYLVGSDKLMRTKSRFITNPLTKIKVETEGSELAINSGNGFGSYKDYRDVMVLGSYGKINIDGIKWFILVEIDKSEAVKDIFLMRNKMFLLVILTSIGVIIMTLIIARKISYPVKNLTAAAVDLMNGAFEKIVFKSNDEIGDLVTAFNAMGEKIIKQEEELIKANKKTVKATFDATDKERKRLALELHDDIGQRLIGTKLILENTDSDKPELLQSQLNLAKQSIDITIQEIRNLINNLLPSVINEFGLTTAIKTLCDDISKIGSMKIMLNSNLGKVDINAEIKVYLFRIIQEALSNIIQHSEADEINIDMNLDEDILLLKVKDNGKGFDQKSITKGNGLINMRERISLLEGDIEINSVLNEGTEILITLTVKRNNE